MRLFVYGSIKMMHMSGPMLLIIFIAFIYVLIE